MVVFNNLVNWNTWLWALLCTLIYVVVYRMTWWRIYWWGRLSTDNNEDLHTLPTSARESRQILQSDFGMHWQCAIAVSEAIAIQESRIQQGIDTMDTYTYVEILKWCFKQRHLVAAKQVHGCVIRSRMEQNTLVANNLLSLCIRYGRLQDARRAIDEIVQKNVYSWTIVIGGYAHHNQMWQEGAQPNEITYLRILKACASPSALEWCKEVRVHIRHWWAWIRCVCRDGSLNSFSKWNMKASNQL